MMPHLETLDSVGQGIDESRAKIVETRELLQAVLDRGIDVPEFREAARAESSLGTRRWFPSLRTNHRPSGCPANWTA